MYVYFSGFMDKQKMLTYLKCAIVISICLNIYFITITIQGPIHKCPQTFCPDNWIGYQNRCYYFSKEEGDWNSSSYNCSTLHSTLATIDTMEEMNFLMCYKCSSDHWIGLMMENNQTGEWVNGTVFNNWFPVRGGGICAYLSDDSVATARCHTERKWICKKNMHHLI
ncbi:C-type lectin domain family 2 member B [Trichechus manatus latirostris]|uniref:C-type lectin domain family 2 member B n=1 Tax=Trichechus manatus latirostris TaxID=127582 RepID=A0A2Y9RQR2_TRIMA|nr:C-type lectin domain family 2 member B [Trichechus manatus latirostris]